VTVIIISLSMGRTKNTARKQTGEHRLTGMTDAMAEPRRKASRSCPQCDRDFRSLSSLRRHCIIKHGKTVNGVAFEIEH